MAFGEHPLGGGPGTDMDPAEIMKHIPKPRRKIWRQEKLVDDVYLQYRDRTEELPEPDLVERIFLSACDATVAPPFGMATGTNPGCCRFSSSTLTRVPSRWTPNRTRTPDAQR